MELAIHDAIVIAKVTLEELLSASKTNAVLSNTHVDAVLKAYLGSSMKVVVTIQVNQPHSLAKSMAAHSHEEDIILCM